MYGGNQDWKEEITLFRQAMFKVFKVQRNLSCGSHVHVAPWTRQFHLDELKTIACAIILYEHQIEALLPPSRRGYPYCRLESLNSEVSPQLQQYLSRQRSISSLLSLIAKLRLIQTRHELLELMQG